MNLKIVTAAIATSFVVWVAGCSSGGSSSQALTGTAAVGAPMVGATITLKDVNGTTLTATADASGNFTFADIGSMRAPFILKASGIVDGVQAELFSALDEKPSGEAVANVTPMTNAIVTQLAQGDPSALFAAPTQLATVVTPAEMSGAVQKTLKALESVLPELGLNGTVDPFKTKFTANSTGVDKLLDLVKFEADATGKMMFTDKASGQVQSIQKTDTVTTVAQKKLPAPSKDLVGLDFSKIKDLITALNAAAANPSSASTLFATGFLHEGLNSSQFGSKAFDVLKTATIQNYQFGACNAAAKVCEGNFNAKFSNGVIIPLFMPVKYVDTGWLLFGDQKPFEFNFNQVIAVNVPPDATVPTSKDFKFGLDLDIQKDEFPDLAGADVQFSYDNGSTWSAVIWSMVPVVGCDSLVPMFPGALANNICTTFIAASSGNDAFDKAAAAFIEGKFKVKVSAKTGGSPSYSFRPKLRFYSEAEATKVMERLIAAVNASARGKNEIPVIPNAEFVSVRVTDAQGGNEFHADFDSYDGSLLQAGPSITVKEACDQALKEEKDATKKATITAACASPTTGKIAGVSQTLFNPANPGERIWVNY